MNHFSIARRLAAGLLAGLMLCSLGGCNQQNQQQDPPQQDSSQQQDTTPTLPDHEGPLTEEEYVAVCQQYYDELMTASNEASLKLEEAINAPANTEEEKRIRQNKMDIAIDLMEKMPPLYTRFIDLQAPESYAEAHELISSGATASGEVLRLTAALAKAAKEDKSEEADALQEQLEGHTTQAQNFSKGLRMVLGEQVGVGDSAK